MYAKCPVRGIEGLLEFRKRNGFCGMPDTSVREETGFKMDVSQNAKVGPDWTGGWEGNVTVREGRGWQEWQSYWEQQAKHCSLYGKSRSLFKKFGRRERSSLTCRKGSAFEELWTGALFYLVFPEPRQREYLWTFKYYKYLYHKLVWKAVPWWIPENPKAPMLQPPSWKLGKMSLWSLNYSKELLQKDAQVWLLNFFTSTKMSHPKYMEIHEFRAWADFMWPFKAFISELLLSL